MVVQVELVSLGTNEASLWPPGRFLGGPGGLGTACPWAFQVCLLRALYLGYLPRGQAWVPGPELPRTSWVPASSLLHLPQHQRSPLRMGTETTLQKGHVRGSHGRQTLTQI